MPNLHWLQLHIFCVWFLIFPMQLLADNDGEAHVELHVLRVIDRDLPSLTADDQQMILEEAQSTIVQKFGFHNITFTSHGSVSVEDFFSTHLPPDSQCLADLNKWRFDPWQQVSFGAAKPYMEKFLKKWTIQELKSFFSKEQAQHINSYNDIINLLIPEYQKKIALLKTFKLHNDQLLLSKEKMPYRSYINWICAMRHQDAYDIILTNEFVLYDLISEPYPHSIFKKCKVGGASLRSPMREAMPGRAIFASTFGMETEIPFLMEDPNRKLNRQQRQSVTGMFIVAHEIGHALFKLIDFYDHPPQCLMTTKSHTDYIYGYKTLLQFPGECPKCLPYIEARRKYFQAKYYYQHKKYKQAIDAFKQVVKMTPKHVDGSYHDFLSDVGVNIAKSYYAQKKLSLAKKWLKSAITIYPYNERPRQLWRKWFQEPEPKK